MLLIKCLYHGRQQLNISFRILQDEDDAQLIGLMDFMQQQEVTILRAHPKTLLSFGLRFRNCIYLTTTVCVFVSQACEASESHGQMAAPHAMPDQDTQLHGQSRQQPGM